MGAGDGSSAAGSASANCSPLDGVYRLTYRELSGNCGAQPEELIEFDEGKSVPSASQRCQPGGESMATPCKLERDSRCTVSDPLTGSLLGTVDVTGTLNEVEDNSAIEGVFEVVLTETSGASCMSSYDVQGERVR
jgi:hypothetical protein